MLKRSRVAEWKTINLTVGKENRRNLDSSDILIISPILFHPIFVHARSYIRGASRTLDRLWRDSEVLVSACVSFTFNGLETLRLSMVLKLFEGSGYLSVFLSSVLGTNSNLPKLPNLRPPHKNLLWNSPVFWKSSASLIPFRDYTLMAFGGLHNIEVLGRLRQAESVFWCFRENLKATRRPLNYFLTGRPT